MSVRKLHYKDINSVASNYVGEVGSIFFDPTTTQLRFGDGVTPGGNSPASGGGTTPVAVHVAAAGTAQGDAAVIPACNVARVTGANSSAGAMLPNIANGASVTIFVDGGTGSLILYPPVGQNFDQQPTNQPFNPSQGTFVFYKDDRGVWVF